MSTMAKWSAVVLAIVLFVGLYLGLSWASRLTPEDVKVINMWIKLAIDGYAEPMPMNKPGKRSW